jgi:glucose-6-phosphate 1-dehydrogenase
LAEKATEVTLQFKRVPHLIFAEHAGLAANSLTICIQPDEGMHLQFETKVPGAGMRAEPVDMEFHFGDHFGAQALPEAYERLLLDAIHGDASLFARSDEIELAWRLVDPLTVDMAPVSYAPGSWGPTEADALLSQTGREWLEGCACAHKDE